jgi:hypothetical protein
MPKNHFGGKKSFEEIEKRDILKKEKCVENSVDLLYFSNLPKYDLFLGNFLFKDEVNLVQYIKEHYERKLL